MKNTKTTAQKQTPLPVIDFTSHSPLTGAVTVIEKTTSSKKMEQQVKLIRRYSFDDNGGGYSGL